MLYQLQKVEVIKVAHMVIGMGEKEQEGEVAEVERRFTNTLLQNLDDGGDATATDSMTYTAQIW
jgi:hypothetical protein